MTNPAELHHSTAPPRGRLAILAASLVLIMGTAGCLAELQERLSSHVDPLDYLQDDYYTQWVIEVDYAAGFRPDTADLTLVKSRLVEVVNKPDGVTFAVDDAIEAAGKTWTTQELLELAATYRDQETGDGKVVTHLIFVDGRSSSDTGNSKALGVAIGFDLIVIFAETIQNSCRLNALPPCTTSPTEVRQAVLVHEFGHALGLVNRADGSGDIPVPKQSPHEASECNGSPDTGHSKNQNSVMYCAVETTAILNLLGDIPNRFDAADMEDLCAAGGRC